MATRYEIVNGPSKFDLMLALFDRSMDCRDKKGYPTFELMAGQTASFEGTTFKLDIQSVAWDRAAKGESYNDTDTWFLEGYSWDSKPMGIGRFKVWFNTKTRKGWTERI